MKKVIVLAVMIILVLNGCGPVEGEEIKSNCVVLERGTNSLYRCIDEQADVVCYWFLGYEKGGVDCMPLSDTALDF